jgi:hypothetical protein
MRTHIKQEKKKKCSPKLETLLVRTQSRNLHKEGAQLPSHLLWLWGASTEMRPHPLAKKALYSVY